MSSEPMDQLSELPDSLIYHIFWLLPMTDVIRTSMLSKRWQKLWTTTPYLNFNDYTTDWPTNYVRDFVNRALILWRGIKILKFKIDFHSKGDGVLYLDFDVWLCFAMEKGVEELYIHVMYVDDLLREGYDSIEEGYWLIECLYSCSSLKVLSLKGCNLNIDVKLHWDHLKSLTIKGYGLEEDLINQVLSGSPRLEVFILTLREIGENLSIRSSSLKRLSIEKYLCYDDDDEPSTDTELRIWSPNLETLEVSGVPYSKCLLMNVSSLTHATLAFKGRDLFFGNDFLGETLRQIFPTIQYVTLSGWCIKALGDMKKKELLSPFPNVKYLHLDICFKEYNKKIVDLLEIFPKLKRLVLQDETGVNSRFVQESLIFDAESNLKFEANLPKSFLLQLRTVEVTWFGGDHMIFPLIEILLKYASKLEMMTFRVRPSNLLVLASQRLLRMPKSSPTAEFIFRGN